MTTDAGAVTKDDIFSWIQKSLQNEDITKYDIILRGKLDKGNGYVGEIIFAKVIGTTKENVAKELELVVKHGKPNDHLKKTTPFRICFETEIYFYSKVVPAFTRFQVERGVQDNFDAVPKCYGTFIEANMEAIVFSDLRSLGYQLHDRSKPLNPEHQKKVLREYGKFHALSFAFRDQKPQEFSALSDCPNAAKELFKDKAARDMFQYSVDDAMKVLEEKGDYLLLEKMKKILCKNAGDILVNFINEEISHSVITHGDCWNSNFMFKYPNADQTSPSKVMILDWQISQLGSPVYDLSYFIYATSSKDIIHNFSELIDVYYTSFSNFLRQLGSDPEKLFPYSVLKEHWRKYSLYGLIFVPLVLKITMCDRDEVPDLGDLKEGESVASTFNGLNIKDSDRYYERLKPLFTHYWDLQS